MWHIFRTALSIDDLIDEFLHNRTVFFGLTCTIVAAISLPFAVVLVFRGWRYYRRRDENLVKEEKTSDNENAASKSASVLGCFNVSILKTLSRIPLDEIDDEREKKMPTKIEEEKENKSNDEDLGEVEDPVSEPLIGAISDERQSNITKPDEETARVLEDLSKVGLHGKLATAQLRNTTAKIEQSMSEEERKKEEEIRRAQLSAIFKIMQDQGDMYGITDKSELVDQMKLYSV